MDIKEIFQEQIDSVVTDEAKKAFVAWLLSKAVPAVKDIAGDYVARLKEDAKEESGWNSFRDGVVLPLVIYGGIWLAETALNRVADDL